jgi:hypothetical protein
VQAMVPPLDHIPNEVAAPSAETAALKQKSQVASAVEPSVATGPVDKTVGTFMAINVPVDVAQHRDDQARVGRLGLALAGEAVAGGELAGGGLAGGGLAGDDLGGDVFGAASFGVDQALERALCPPWDPVAFENARQAIGRLMVQ